MLVRSMKEGNYSVVAARRAGIAENEFLFWLSQGHRAPRGHLRDLYAEIVAAHASAEAAAVASLFAHMKKDWRAALAYLERKIPSRWSNRKDRAVSLSKIRQSIPPDLRRKYDLRSLAEILRVLDECGAIEPALGGEIDAAIAERDSAHADGQASRVSAA